MGMRRAMKEAKVSVGKPLDPVRFQDSPIDPVDFNGAIIRMEHPL
jgi:hypothetical protein